MKKLIGAATVAMLISGVAAAQQDMVLQAGTYWGQNRQVKNDAWGPEERPVIPMKTIDEGTGWSYVELTVEKAIKMGETGTAKMEAKRAGYPCNQPLPVKVTGRDDGVFLLDVRGEGVPEGCERTIVARAGPGAVEGVGKHAQQVFRLKYDLKVK